MEKSRESERRRRRRKQKNNTKNDTTGDDNDTAAEYANSTADYSSKGNSDPQKALELLEIEYVPEKAELDGVLDYEFRKIFEKFNFVETATTGEADKHDGTATDLALKKKDSDSEEEEHDTQQIEKGMKIAELKQICTRLDVVEVLHDAFFKHQTKPKLTSHGDLYYEANEFE
ncbi:hypothetical protein CASFOL_037285 [Castilleja foliolosa]|uniref:DUF382 domain-containing protein n=1 Tax=Castilleja foliolosa TaxID=1961234 RepID=A0ABD3BNJ3_9LAMI